MTTFYSKTLLIKGTAPDIRRFVINACNANVKKDGILSLKGDWTPVNGTRNGFIIPVSENTVYGEKCTILSVHYKQEDDIFAEDFKNLSKYYNLDFRLFAFEPTMTIGRNIEVVSGAITLNELFFTETDVSEDWWPETAFGDSPIRTERTFDFPCKMLAALPDSYSKILKSVAKDQQKRLVDKCPCCGHDEMLIFNGKTDGWPSQQGGVYICHHCGFDELDETNRPLSRWAVINSTGIESEEESDLVLL